MCIYIHVTHIYYLEPGRLYIYVWYVCVCISMYTYIYVYMYVNKNIHICIYIYVNICMHIHICMYTCTYTYIHIIIYTNISVTFSKVNCKVHFLSTRPIGWLMRISISWRGFAQHSRLSTSSHEPNGPFNCQGIFCICGIFRMCKFCMRAYVRARASVCLCVLCSSRHIPFDCKGIHFVGVCACVRVCVCASVTVCVTYVCECWYIFWCACACVCFSLCVCVSVRVTYVCERWYGFLATISRLLQLIRHFDRI